MKQRNRRKDDFGYMPTKPPGSPNRCFECGVMTTGLHHVVPVVCGGTKQIPLCEEHHNLVHGNQTIQSELIKRGIEKAKARGKVWNVKKVDAKTALRLRDLRNDGLSYRDIAKSVGLSVGTVHSSLNPRQPNDIVKSFTYDEYLQNRFDY